MSTNSTTSLENSNFSRRVNNVSINEEKNRVVLVTGGTQGIGLGIARKFLENNYFVYICSRKERLQDDFEFYKKKIYGKKIGNWKYIKCDVSSEKDRDNLVKIIFKEKNKLDVLINNAGVAPKERLDLLEMKEESFERVIKINLQGPFFLTQKIARKMIETIEKMGNMDYEPCIINISSISAYTSSISRGQYCISKAGISMMTKLFADRLSEFNIPVYEIRPGIILTPMTASVKEKYDKLIEEGLLPIKRWGTPEDVAKAALILANGEISYSTGQIINIDGGFHLRRL